MYKSKSRIGLLCDFSSQSQHGPENVSTRKGNSPSPLDFDAFVPWICSQWQAEDVVTVKIIHLIKEEYRQPGKTKSGKPKSSRSLKTKITAYTSGPVVKTPEKSCLGNYDTSVDVPVSAYYDSQGRLVSIAINNYTHGVPKKVIQAFGFCAVYHHFLTSFAIRRCTLTSPLLFEISSLLFNSNITDICLDNTFIAEGNYYILLDQVSQLRYLSLNGCKINNAVCEKIVQKLHNGYPAARILQLLDLGSNFISDEGAKRVGEMLRGNRHLLHINLAGNRITDTGLTVIMDALKEFPLWHDEILEMRRERIRYIQNKTVVYTRCLQEVLLRTTAVDTFSIHTGKSSTSSAKNNSKFSKKPKPQGSFHTRKEVQKQRTVSDPEDIAEIMTNRIVGEFHGPYGPNCVVMVDGYHYAKGNFSLSSINLAYNNLEYVSVQKINEVLTYQANKCNPPGMGLMRVVIDGNFIPESCAELDNIALLLKKKIVDTTSLKMPQMSSHKMKYHSTKFS